jgi:DNA invertase Pin-like site-specific DNA recombinase
VVPVTQRIDLSGTVGHLVTGVLFSIAEIELQNTRECQAAGIATAKAKGVYKGRAKGTTKAKSRRAKEARLDDSEIAQVLNVSEPPAFLNGSSRGSLDPGAPLEALLSLLRRLSRPR